LFLATNIRKEEKDESTRPELRGDQGMIVPWNHATRGWIE